MSYVSLAGTLSLMLWVTMSSVIQFPAEKQFTIEFMLGDDVSMKTSEHEIHWTINYNEGKAVVRARTREQAKQYIKSCSYREVAGWMQRKTGRYISAPGLMKVLKRSE